MTGNTDMHLFITNTLTKKVEAWIRNHSVSGVTTICLLQWNTYSSHRDDQAVDCGLWNVVSLLFKCEVAGYWWELEYAVVHIDLEHPKLDQWVTCLVSMQAMEEQGHFLLSGIMYRSLRHAET
jgi:hypothetical protein